MPLEYASQTEKDVCERVHARWIRAESSAPLVIMIHGRAGTAKVISAFSSSMPERSNLIAPQASLPDLDGFSWLDVNLRQDQAAAIIAAQSVLDFIYKALPLYELNPRSIYLLGFSQGAALSSVLMQMRPDLFNGLVMLAGFAPELYVDADISALKLNHKKVLIAHGSRDQVIPIQMADRSAEYLKQHGAEVTYHQDDVEHKIGVAGMRALKAWTLTNIS